MTEKSDGKIVVTGAGGWLGTEYLEGLREEIGSAALRNKVVCLGSTERGLTLSDGTKLEVRKLDGFNVDSPIEGLVHLAFLTRDKVAHMSLESYSFANLLITSAAVQLIEKHKPTWVATVSSGAVFSSPGGPLENNLQANPYGFTKRIEEALLRDACESVSSNLAIGRLWGAMGAFMPVNRAYAVSDFICQALDTSKIQVRAKHEVFRRYCLAGEFMKVLTRTAKTQNFASFDSGGDVIELSSLAGLIAEHLSADLMPRELEPTAQADRYFPLSQDYEALARRTEVKLATVEQQVLLTLGSHGALNH